MSQDCYCKSFPNKASAEAEAKDLRVLSRPSIDVSQIGGTWRVRVCTDEPAFQEALIMDRYNPCPSPEFEADEKIPRRSLTRPKKRS